MNKRKAMIGWLVYTGGKPIAKRDAEVEGEGSGSREEGRLAAAERRGDPGRGRCRGRGGHVLA